ncbi:MAG: hypothetical protein WD826_11595, partial [Actinomycetota bacterium]
MIGPNGAVNLTRTTTLSAYHDGVEHYITAFEYAGGGGAFGSIVPLPAKPTKVEKGGDWTLKRLERERGEIQGTSAALTVAGGSTKQESARVVMEERIDALDV